MCQKRQPAVSFVECALILKWMRRKVNKSGFKLEKTDIDKDKLCRQTEAQIEGGTLGQDALLQQILDNYEETYLALKGHVQLFWVLIHGFLVLLDL